MSIHKIGTSLLKSPVRGLNIGMHLVLVAMIIVSLQEMGYSPLEYLGKLAPPDGEYGTKELIGMVGLPLAGIGFLYEFFIDTFGIKASKRDRLLSRLITWAFLSLGLIAVTFHSFVSLPISLVIPVILITGVVIGITAAFLSFLTRLIPG